MIGGGVQLAMDQTKAVVIRVLDVHHRAPRRPRLAVLLAAIACLFSIFEAAAQQYGNVCQTNVGACLYNPMPLGAPCVCFTPMGQFPGTILGGGGYGKQNMASPICRSTRSMRRFASSAAGSIGRPMSSARSRLTP